MTSTVSAATTVYYTSYVGNIVPLYNGAFFVNTQFAEVSQATTDTTKSPAACTTNSNYDLFAWNDSGTLRCTRGPAWSSDTSRGTGAGTTELDRVNGIYTNKVAITNGPGANRGTYVGTIRTNGYSQVDYIFGSSAAGGGAASFGVWNCYNRVSVNTGVNDSTDTWTYALKTWRAADNSTTNRVSYVCGLAEDGVQASFTSIFTTSAGSVTGLANIGIDSTTAISGYTGYGVTAASVSATAVGTYSGLPGLGFHYVQALESCNGVGTVTFVGDAGEPLFYPTGLAVGLRT
jgi:hypothetical protein